MTTLARWISPPAANARYSDGWWPRIVWPYVIFGNVNLEPPSHWVLDARTFETVALADLPPDVQASLLAARQQSLPLVDPAGPVPGADWMGRAFVAPCHGVPWQWVSVEAGSNNQVFAVGRPLDGDPRALIVEMPAVDMHAHYDEATDAWTLVGNAMGNHGTPDYRDGELHVVRVSAETPRTTLAEHLTAFNFPIRLPASIGADVWTFGDAVTGTVGGGARADRPNRQGIGLWPDGRPWLDLDLPVLGVWISPHDAVQALRFYSEVVGDRRVLTQKFVRLVAAHRLDDLGPSLAAQAQEILDRGSLDFGPIEERMAVAICRRTGCSLTVYDDHAMMEVPGSEGTRYRPELLEKAFALQRDGLGVVMGINAYPTGQAGWAFEDCVNAMTAGSNVFTDNSGRPKTGFDWLQLDHPDHKPMPAIFTLALYTQAGNWHPTMVARTLEHMVRIGEHVKVLCYDVFGVKRGGESAEWNAWADQWLAELLARSGPCDPARWPKTATPPPPPPPPPGNPLTDLADDIIRRNEAIQDRLREGN